MTTDLRLTHSTHSFLEKRMRSHAATLVSLLSIFHPSFCFVPQVTFRALQGDNAQAHVANWRRSLPLNTQKDDTYGDSLLEQRQQLVSVIEVLDSIKSSIELSDSNDQLSTIQVQLDDLEQRVSQLTTELLPPAGLSKEEYARAMLVFAKLPILSRLAFCEALAYSDPVEAATDFDRIPDIITRLYDQRDSLTPLRMQLAMQTAKSRKIIRKQKLNLETVSTSRTTENRVRSLFSAYNDGLTEEERRQEAAVQQLLGRVTRKDNRVATQEDLDIVMAALDKETFVVSEKEVISGGYVLRGQNKKKSSADLIQTLDDKLPSKWSGQVCYLPDFTSRAMEAGLGENESVLLVLKKDMSPTASRWLLSFTSAAAVFTAFLFAVGVYGGNELVTGRVTSQTEMGDFSGLNWFNGKVVDVLIPIFAVQIVHDLGHYIVAARDKIKLSPPTLLPFWSLPFAGTQISIKESPRTLNSLFDFALAGPLFGLLTSVFFLLYGLELGSSMDPEAAQYLPALPVSLLRLSTLGGTLVDQFFGGNGFITLQDPNTPIPMHPFAIAGFSGLMMSALELLPLGSTNGGRLSLALFGRQGHSAVGGLTWFTLLIVSLFLEHVDVLIGGWIVYNIAQNDPEVPCRDEVEPVDGARGLIAFAMWFVAALTLAPM